MVPPTPRLRRRVMVVWGHVNGASWYDRPPTPRLRRCPVPGTLAPTDPPDPGLSRPRRMPLLPASRQLQDKLYAAVADLDAVRTPARD